MKHALRNRLDRLERRHAAPHPTDVFKGMGISAVLALTPEPKHDPELEATPAEAAYMRNHRTEIAALCQPSRERGLAALLDSYRMELAVARRLLAEEATHV